MTYRILVNDRKKVVARMEKLTGEKSVYTRVPRCAYVLRGLVVEKDNTIVTEEGADIILLRKLINEGLVENPVGDDDLVEEPVDDEEPVGDDDLVEEPVGDEEPEEDSDPYASLIASETEEEENIPLEPEEEAITPSEAEGELVKPSISFPLEQHRAESVCNLIFTIYSRGKLISKSTGGNFSASEELVERLRSCSGITRPEEVIEMVHEEGADALQGLSFGDGKVTFDGFSETCEPVCIKAWTALAAAINKSAIKQYHVHAKVVDDTNEKFSFRTWLTRLGMNGPELKEERNVLYRNLSGHTAFRTARDEEKWKARQAAKREALRALLQAERVN